VPLAHLDDRAGRRLRRRRRRVEDEARVERAGLDDGAAAGVLDDLEDHAAALGQTLVAQHRRRHAERRDGLVHEGNHGAPDDRLIELDDVVVRVQHVADGVHLHERVAARARQLHRLDVATLHEQVARRSHVHEVARVVHRDRAERARHFDIDGAVAISIADDDPEHDRILDDEADAVARGHRRRERDLGVAGGRSDREERHLR
jgi:hypothetical protein